MVQCGSGVTHAPLSAVDPHCGSVLDHLQEMHVCVGGACRHVEFVLQWCLFEPILVSLRRQYPALLHQMTQPSPKLSF